MTVLKPSQKENQLFASSEEVPTKSAHLSSQESEYEEEPEHDPEEQEEDEEYEEGEEEEEDEDEEDLKRNYLDRIHYSQRYNDDVYEYRHVILPKEYYQNYVSDEYKDRLLEEPEWRAIGITQSPGWIHYELHGPEPHIFLFRRPIQK